MFAPARQHRPVRNLALISALIVGAVIVGLVAGRIAARSFSDSAQARSSTNATDDAYPDALHPQHISFPDGPPRVDTGLLDELGRAVTVSCASCHANMEPNRTRRSGDDLAEFHRGLHYNHGSLTCVSCHNPDNYNALRLADGSTLPYRDVTLLCGQCHTPQLRDYERSAHGGMTGYWDRTRGPQYRKSCIDCHDPHAPQFPHMHPTFKPHDRFLAPPH